MDIKPINLDRQPKEPTKMISIPGGTWGRKSFGVALADTYSLDRYLALVIANSLRLFIANSHGTEDADEFELIASYFEFYAADTDSIIIANIDFSQDIERDINDPDWLSLEGCPGQQEFCDKSLIVDNMRRYYIGLGLAWLAEHFTGLWD